jgi:hypothetical protein
MGKKRLTTEEFVQRATEIHGDKYDYSKVIYLNTMAKVNIICKIHGEFQQTPNKHLSHEHGCPYCGNNVILTTEIFLDRSKVALGDRYDYSQSVYVNSSTLIKIRCKEHDLWFNQRPREHILGQLGCKTCRDIIAHNKFAKTTEQFIKEAQELHGSIRYSYHKTKYNKALEKVEIVCNKHNMSFFVKPSHHLRGIGCPLCNSSFGERIIKLFLDNNKIQHIHQKRFYDCRNKKPLPFDFYLPEHNTCIEYDGEQHYFPVIRFQKHYVTEQNAIKIHETVKIHDSIKTKYCEDNNIKLLRISYTQRDDIKNILSKYLLNNHPHLENVHCEHFTQPS